MRERDSAPLIDSKIEKKAYVVGRGQTWHRPEDVEAALDKSLEDLGLGYGKYENPHRVLTSMRWARQEVGFWFERLN